MSERTAPSLAGFESSQFPEKKSAPPETSAPKRSALEYPGGWESLELKINEAKPNMKYPGLSLEIMKHLDGDIQMTRDWSMNHALYFDSMMAPQGAYALTTAVTRNNNTLSAQMVNGNLIGDARVKYKNWTFGAYAHLFPQQAMMMMGAAAADDFRASLKYKGSSYSVASEIGTSSISLAYLRTVLPGVTSGVKIARLMPSKEFKNSYFLRFRNRSQKDTLQVLYANDQQRADLNFSFLKRVTPYSSFVTTFQYAPVSKLSSWWFGYAFAFPHTGTQISAMVDSDFKVALSANFRMPNLDAFGINVFGEIDHRTGQHKTCVGIQIAIPSEEQAKAQEDMMRQQMAGMA